MNTGATVVVTGLIGQHPLLGGMTWHYLNYVLGFARLGCDVYYIEDSGEWPYNLDGGESGEDFRAISCRANVEYLAGVMRGCGLESHWAYRCPMDTRWSGLSRGQVEKIVDRADVVFNVSGSLASAEDYRGRGRLAYIDTDPVFTQIKLTEGDQLAVQTARAHDVHFTFGELVATTFPGTGYSWRPTRQPVVIDAWRRAPTNTGHYTTVMNWSSYAPVMYEGRRFGQKDVEFARFLDLPRNTGAVLEVAVRGTAKGILPGSEDDDREPQELTAALRVAGWRVVDAATLCAGVDGYRAYIHGSRAEWSVAKEAYVVGRSGWFSDRSVCYLAAGKPVIVQDTGFSEFLPVGEGLHAFDTLEEASVAIRRVEADYEREAHAAAAVAAEYFDAAVVLTKLLDEATSVSAR